MLADAGRGPEALAPTRTAGASVPKILFGMDTATARCVQPAAGRIIAGHLGDQAPNGDDCDTPTAQEG